MLTGRRPLHGSTPSPCCLRGLFHSRTRAWYSDITCRCHETSLPRELLSCFIASTSDRARSRNRVLSRLADIPTIAPPPRLRLERAPHQRNPDGQDHEPHQRHHHPTKNVPGTHRNRLSVSPSLTVEGKGWGTETPPLSSLPRPDRSTRHAETSQPSPFSVEGWLASARLITRRPVA